MKSVGALASGGEGRDPGTPDLVCLPSSCLPSCPILPRPEWSWQVQSVSLTVELQEVKVLRPPPMCVVAT
jgi:hypothetical protein